MHDKSRELRGMLADVGIVFTEPVVLAPAARAREPLDEDLELRERIREILIEAGAPANDVGWLTASCPDVETALGYLPPPTAEAVEP